MKYFWQEESAQTHEAKTGADPIEAARNVPKEPPPVNADTENHRNNLQLSRNRTCKSLEALDAKVTTLKAEEYRLTLQREDKALVLASIDAGLAALDAAEAKNTKNLMKIESEVAEEISAMIGGATKTTKSKKPKTEEAKGVRAQIS